MCIRSGLWQESDLGPAHYLQSSALLIKGSCKQLLVSLMETCGDCSGVLFALVVGVNGACTGTLKTLAFLFVAVALFLLWGKSWWLWAVQGQSLGLLAVGMVGY